MSEMCLHLISLIILQHIMLHYVLHAVGGDLMLSVLFGVIILAIDDITFMMNGLIYLLLLDCFSLLLFDYFINVSHIPIITCLIASRIHMTSKIRLIATKLIKFNCITVNFIISTITLLILSCMSKIFCCKRYIDCLPFGLILHLCH